MRCFKRSFKNEGKIRDIFQVNKTILSPIDLLTLFLRDVHQVERVGPGRRVCDAAGNEEHLHRDTTGLEMTGALQVLRTVHYRRTGCLLTPDIRIVSVGS